MEIIPVSTIAEALEKVKLFPPGTTLLGGERGSRRIEGFDLGNSPKEYASDRVKGRRLILTTTNGTKAFHWVSSGEEVMVGSFFNIGAVAQRSLESGRDLLLFPSGDGGKFSLEDTVCGGMLIDLMIKKNRKTLSLTDASHTARILYRKFEGNLLEAFRLSHHGRELVKLGLEDDLSYCSQVDTTDIVPIFKEGAIRAR